MGRKKWFLAGGICLLLIAGVSSFLLYENGKVYSECYVEAGVEVTAQDFLRSPDGKAYFTGDSDAIDITIPGEYHMKIQTGYFAHKSTLYITDTIAPQGEPVRVNLEMGEECSADAFVTDITDATQVAVTYAQEPDFEQPGRQSVQIALTDAGGNKTTVESELYISQVVSELTVEAGSAPPKLEDFVIEGENAEFLTNIHAYSYTVPGERKVMLKVDGVKYEVDMHIVDTTPPEVEVRNIQGFTLLPRTIDDFIVSIHDVTPVTYTFVEEPDVTSAGEQSVDIRVADSSGNETIATAQLVLEDDVEAPVINGVTDLTVFIGASVSYKKNVTVTDNCPDGLTLTVDNSAVNLSAEGTYPITYTAKDYAGNETAVAANITVRPRVYDENEVYAMADGVLARIIRPEMSLLEKLEAIHLYVRTHIRYTGHSEKGNWVRGAYEGFVDGQGDCYIYFAMSKALMIRAGIANMDIEKIPAATRHYWNLVNTGEGWYHFDATPRSVDNPHIVLWTDEQLMAYSTTHNNSHNYDHSLYPEVN